MKLISKTAKGIEYIHSKNECYAVSNRSANKICQAMNDARWKLKDNEVWHVYDYNWCTDNDTFMRLSIYNGIVKAKRR